MKKRIRIKDVAEKAGVSTGTVDRVIHNRGRVAEKVKENILRVIKELGFERNQFASALALNRNIRISVLLPNYQMDLYWRASFDGLEKASKFVQPYGISTEIHLFDLFQPESFLKTAKELLKNPPDGILFPPVFLEEGQFFLNECKKRKIPTVIINTDINQVESLSYIGQDSYQSGILGARLLNFGLNSGETVLILNLAKKSINAPHLVEKEKGFRFYFEQETIKKITILKKNFNNFNNKKDLNFFLNSIIKKNPSLSGIFFTNSRAHLAIDCMDDTFAEKIKIVGFDLIQPNIDYLQSGKINFLINQNPVKQGYLGIISLYNHLIWKEEIDKKQYLPLDIVVKENFKYYSTAKFLVLIYIIFIQVLRNV